MSEKHVDFMIFTVMAIILLLFGVISKRYYLIIFGVVMAGFAIISVIDMIISAKMKIDVKNRVPAKLDSNSLRTPEELRNKKRREKHGSIHE